MLAMINRIVQETSRATNLVDALTLIVTHIQETLSADATSIFLCDDESAEYVLLATQGLNEALVGKARVKFGEGLIGLVGEREEPINIENAQEHADFYKYPKLEQRPYCGFLGIPIIHRAHLQGVLVVQQEQARVFAEEEVAFLSTLSAQLSSEIAAAKAKGALTTMLQKGRRRGAKDRVLVGVSGAQGVGIGKAVVVFPQADINAVPDRRVDDIEGEIEAFEKALAQARADIQTLQLRSKKVLSIAENAIFDAYLRILDSRTLMNEIEELIQAGQWAQGAVKQVILKHVSQFESLEDVYLKERASDFRDLGRRILGHLQSSEKSEMVNYPKNTILVSDEVTATSILEVPEGCLVGIISGAGSSNSHVAILARALGIASVMGVHGYPITQLAGMDLIVDGYHGQVYVQPSTSLKKEFKALAEEEIELDEELQSLSQQVTETTDGHVVNLYVNTGLAVDGGLSLSAGAEGVGLYRSEMPFMLRDRFPSEAEQYIMYRQLLNTFYPRTVVMRTLDIGGDKQLSYFPLQEENPFLGWRGIRITLDHPDIFLQQLRAMLKASVDLNNLSIMLPMIGSVGEVEKSIVLLNQAMEELREEGFTIKKPPVGIMIELPAAVFQAHQLAKRVDFVSVGSNDLIQYILAVDRNNARVAHLYDGLHPAVLRALADVVKGVHKAGKKVSICGEMAGDPLAVPLLLGMGYDSLSMSARVLLRAKWVITKFELSQAKELVKDVLKMDDAMEVRCHMEMMLEEMGLGGLIRAGK
jgi:phosphotransferase system, enzyme I, PtsP